jgi:hypothetical protein
MRVLVIGEGPHDVGLRDHWCERRKTRVELPGWLHVFLGRLAKPDETIDITALRNRDIVLTPKLSREYRPLPEKHGAKALMARYKAKVEHFDLVVFMADTDSKDDRNWDKHHACIIEGFSKISDGPIGVVCLPKCSSESWLLSDVAAWAALGLTDMSKLPEHPETCWGERDDPKGGHPHRLFARICGLANLTDSRETRVDVAEKSTMTTMARQCPKSFAAFWRELDAAGFAIPAPVP